MSPTCQHCGTAIEEHEAARCLDAWVASALNLKVGWSGFSEHEYGHSCDLRTFDTPEEAMSNFNVDPDAKRAFAIPSTHYYSSDIAAAWEVVEHVVKSLKAVVDVQVRYGSECVVWVYTEKGEYVSIHNSAPLAICRAAIMTAMQEEKA